MLNFDSENMATKPVRGFLAQSFYSRILKWFLLLGQEVRGGMGAEGRSDLTKIPWLS